MKITNGTRSFESTEKRFYIPGARIELTCGKCGKPAVLDLGDNYLSCPTFNKPFKEHVSCGDDECGYETPIRILLTVDVQAAP